MTYKDLKIVHPVKSSYMYAEYVISQCADCEATGRNKVGNLIQRLKKKGFPWACPVCQKKRASEAAKIRESQYSPEEKTRKAKLALQKFRERTGLNNPMDLKGARKKQLEATTNEEFRRKAVLRNEELNKDPNYKKKLSEGQLRRISENPEAASAQTAKLLAASRSPEARKKAGRAIARIHAEEPHRMTGTKELEKWNTYPELKFERYKKLQESNRANDFTSKAEREILAWIHTMFPNAKRSFVGNAEVDIKIEERKLCIEYHGCYWHTESKVGKTYHLEKTQMAEKHGYRLVQIFDFEWEQRREQVMDFVKSALGLNEKIGARKCDLREVDKRQAALFLERNHIQGSLRHGLSLCLGLFYEEELVALATFGKHHRGHSRWVLNRFCCKHGLTVVGGLSRLSKRAVQILESGLISWADRRLSQGTGYLASGWEIDQELDPDYFYWKDGEVFAKQSRMKSKVGTPEGMTEAEHAAIEGFERVWDCGKIRMIYRVR